MPNTFRMQFTIARGCTAAFGAALLAMNNWVNANSRELAIVVADAFAR